MKRLTTWIDGHVFYTQGRYETTIPAEMETEDMRQCLKRLAAYEDTGLEPEEILTGLELAKVACAGQEMKKTSDELNRIKTERQALKDEVDYLKKRLGIEINYAAQMKRERNAAVKTIGKLKFTHRWLV